MYRRILVPLDGSELSAAILPHAEELAKRFEAELVLLQTVTPLTQLVAQTAPTTLEAAAPSASLELATEAYDAEKAAAREYLERTAVSLRGKQLKVRWEAIEDQPGDAILAKAGEVDLIAMSTHGHGGLGRLVFGSVTDHVLRHSPVPVLVVRPSNA